MKIDIKNGMRRRKREREKDWIRKVKLKEETDLELHCFLRESDNGEMAYSLFVL